MKKNKVWNTQCNNGFTAPSFVVAFYDSAGGYENLDFMKCCHVHFLPSFVQFFFCQIFFFRFVFFLNLRFFVEIPTKMTKT